MNTFYFGTIVGFMFVVIGIVLYSVCRLLGAPNTRHHFYEGSFAGLIVAGVALMVFAFLMLPA